MKKFNKTGVVQFLLGVIVGGLMFGGAVAYAVGVIANPTTSKVFVNGSEIKAEAYNIHDNNFFMLRDVAAAVDFSVVWDGANNRILIDTSRGYDPNDTMPVSPTPVQTPTTTLEPAMTIEEMKAEIVRLTNIERVNAGESPLEVLQALMDTAQAKADDMITNNYHGHISPTYGTPGEMIFSIIPKAKSCGENLVVWTYTPQDAIDGWMNSQGHKANILDNRFTHIGVGIVGSANEGYWIVQQFIQL